MKPEWKDAPEWANYLAMDRDRCWFWFEFEPVAEMSIWYQPIGLTQLASRGPEWEQTLEARP